jgi:hypothetical protein
VVKVFETPAKDGEWYTQYVTVIGKRIIIKVGTKQGDKEVVKTIYEYVEPDGVTGTRKLSKGTFAFQQHDPGSKPCFKNIMVKRLSDDAR